MPAPKNKHLMLEVHVQNELQLAAPSDETLVQWATKVLTHEGITAAEICIRIVDQNESQLLNNSYRSKNYATNVLSFPADIPEEFSLGVMGDLAICSEVVSAESVAHKIDLNARWAHMISHGVLHLLGYDHLEESQALVMETLETELLVNWGYNDPYQPIDITS